MVFDRVNNKVGCNATQWVFYPLTFDKWNFLCVHTLPVTSVVHVFINCHITGAYMYEWAY
jgi:hypothetical protein